MGSDSDPRFVFLEASRMPDTIDLCEDEEFNLDGATQFLRSAADYQKVSESVHSNISDETKCSMEVDIEAVGSGEASTGGLSEKSVNDVYPPADYENFEIDEDEAIADLKVLELKILPTNDDRHLNSISDLAQSKTSRSPLQHLNFLMQRHRESIKDLVDIFPTD